MIVGDLLDRVRIAQWRRRSPDAGSGRGRDHAAAITTVCRFARQPDWTDAGLSSGEHYWTHPVAAAETLTSYGIDFDRRSPPAPMPRCVLGPRGASALALRDVALRHLTPQALFVHAGIRSGVDLTGRLEHDLVWIRGRFRTTAPITGRWGRTATPSPIRSRILQPAGYRHRRGLMAAR